jgi:hypothetical protein
MLASSFRRPIRTRVAGGAALGLVFLLGAGLAASRAQTPPLEPASTGGLAAVDRALARLSTHKRLLVVAAHPDDEDKIGRAHV